MASGDAQRTWFPVMIELLGQTWSPSMAEGEWLALRDLHLAIFKAHDRWEHHSYACNVGQSPRDRSRLFIARDGLRPMTDARGDPEVITLDALDVHGGQHCGDIFDTGDSWPHELEVRAIKPGPLQGDSPIIIEKVGPLPPQCPEDEEEDGADEWPHPCQREYRLQKLKPPGHAPRFLSAFGPMAQ